MSLQSHIDLNDGRLHVVISGGWSFNEFRGIVAEVAEQCAFKGTKHILVNAQGILDDIPGFERFEAGKHIAHLISHDVRIAVVWHARLITKLGENTAVNRGANLAMFGDTGSAIAWLEAPGHDNVA